MFHLSELCVIPQAIMGVISFACCARSNVIYDNVVFMHLSSRTLL